MHATQNHEWTHRDSRKREEARLPELFPYPCSSLSLSLSASPSLCSSLLPLEIYLFRQPII